MSHTALPRRVWRQAGLTLGALAIAASALSATARPARADTDDLMRFLAGAVIVGAIINAIDDNARPSYAGRWALPGACLETVSVRGRRVAVYNHGCLNRAGYRNLPQQCRRDFRINGRDRRGYVADCLFDQGYRRSGYSTRWPGEHISGDPRPSPNASPYGQRPPRNDYWRDQRPPRNGQWHDQRRPGRDPWERYPRRPGAPYQQQRP